MKRYTEKWISIRAYLGGYQPPKLTAEQLHEIRSLFLDLQKPFESVRHNPGCDKSDKCHKSPGKCRHNFLNYNFVIIQLLRIMELDHIYRPWLPQLKTQDKLKKLNHYWKPMMEILGWKYVEVVKKQVKDRHGWKKRIKEEDEKALEEKKDEIILIPAESELTKGEDIPDEKQDEVVENWSNMLRNRLKFKSYDDGTLEYEEEKEKEENTEEEERKDPLVVTVRVIPDAVDDGIEWV